MRTIIELPEAQVEALDALCRREGISRTEAHPARRGPGRTWMNRRSDTVAASVDEYLDRLDAPRRNALSRLRDQIRRAAPMATEVISYQIPTYRHYGPLVHFAAQPKHLSFTVVSLDLLSAVRNELEGFEVSGRTIHFSPEKPLPAALVMRIVEARVRENEARAKTKK